MKKLLVLIAGAVGATLLKKKLDEQQAEKALWAEVTDTSTSGTGVGSATGTGSTGSTSTPGSGASGLAG